MPRSVYIHIPFCEHICPYCDFNKYVLRGQPVDDYLNALDQEMAATFERWPARDGIETIFVGGGTPTSLTAAQMEQFLASVNRHVQPLHDRIEFTMEANPGTVDKEKLRVMRQGGVNRLSFGVQTFNHQLLQSLGRIHEAKHVFQSVEAAREAGFQNISIDLMFGLPGQNVDMLNESIDAALSLQVPHVSAYSLKIEEGTHFQRLHEQGKLSLPADDEEANMYELLMKRMEQSGYMHYEISNFAYPGWESQHNRTYWLNEAYYGLGAGAHGFVEGIRHENTGPVDDYIRLVENAGVPRVQTHCVSPTESMEDTMILGLRLQEGVSAAAFEKKHGCSLESVFGEEIERLCQRGLLERCNNGVRLTRQGVLFGNDVFASFLAVYD